jgi:hypothetical protein
LAVSEKSQTCRNASPPANPPHQSIGEAVRSGKFQILGEGLKWIDAGTHPTVWSIINLGKKAVRSGKFQILGEGLKWIDAGTHPTVWSIIPKMRWQIIGGNLGTGPHIL